MKTDICTKEDVAAKRRVIAHFLEDRRRVLRVVRKQRQRRNQGDSRLCHPAQVLWCEAARVVERVSDDVDAGAQRDLETHHAGGMCEDECAARRSRSS
jgi:hypothetical protein